MGVPITDGPIEYIDGFDDYNSAQFLRYWNAGDGTISAGAGRNGGGALHGFNPGAALTLPPVATRTVGFAIINTGTSGGTLFVFTDGGTGGANYQIMLLYNSDGTVGVYRGNQAALLGTTVVTLGATWSYVEFSATIHPTAGSFTLKFNGATVASGTGLNTRATTNSSCNGLMIGPMNISGYVDDFYCRADAIFCGDCRVETKLPTGAGATSNFTRGGADSGTNWGQVDDNPANDDTDYVVSSTAGDIDLYTYPALATVSGAVLAVQVCPVVRNDTAGSVTAAPTVRQATTSFPGAAQTIGSTTYSACPQVYNNAPAGGAWTLASVNAAQFGLKRVS